MMGETLDPKNKKEKNRRKLYKFGKKILDEDEAVSFIHRLCLQEEEEYLKIKAGEVDNTARAASSSLSSSSKKVKKTKIKVCYGDIYELFRPSAKLPDPVVRALTIYCSRTTLAHYNAEHETHYKLVEPLVSAHGFSTTGTGGFHCNFTATKLEKDNTPDLKLFYGEFECLRTKVRNIQCCIIDASTALQKCCPSCPRDLYHCPCKRHRYVNFTFKIPANCQIPIDSSGAEVALARYNRKHGTDYEFVKVCKMSSRLEHTSFKRTHCIFTAKLESPCTPDVSLRWFFADYGKSTTTKPYYAVPHCCILDTEENLDTFLQNERCRFCGGRFLHPPGYAPQYLNVGNLMSKLHPTV